MAELDLVKTGISGLDAILSLGIPRGNVTNFFSGRWDRHRQDDDGPRVRLSRRHDVGEPGIIVLFEVSPDRVVRDAACFGGISLRSSASANSKSSLRHARCSSRSCSRLTVCSSRRLGRSAPAASTWTALPAPPAPLAVRSFATPFTSIVDGLQRENLTAVFAVEGECDRRGPWDHAARRIDCRHGRPVENGGAVPRHGAVD